MARPVIYDIIKSRLKEEIEKLPVVTLYSLTKHLGSVNTCFSHHRFCGLYGKHTVDINLTAQSLDTLFNLFGLCYNIHGCSCDFKQVVLVYLYDRVKNL